MIIPCKDGKSRGPRGGGSGGGAIGDGGAVEKWSPIIGQRSGIVIPSISDIFASTQAGLLRGRGEHF